MPLLIDLCCGRGGWSNGFIAEGWEAAGIDLEPQADYKGFFVQCDLMDVTAAELAKADFIVCSTPCEQFSVHCMKHFHANPPWPHLGITLFNHARTICEQSGKPYVMENVRCAERFVGKAVNHCGPFYLWGNAVPAIFPPECYAVTKGMGMGSANVVRGMTSAQRKKYRKQFPIMQSTHGSKARKEATASIATIPLDISRYVAQMSGMLASHG